MPSLRALSLRQVLDKNAHPYAQVTIPTGTKQRGVKETAVISERYIYSGTCLLQQDLYSTGALFVHIFSFSHLIFI